MFKVLLASRHPASRVSPASVIAVVVHAVLAAAAASATTIASPSRTSVIAHDLPLPAPKPMVAPLLADAQRNSVVAAPPVSAVPFITDVPAALPTIGSVAPVSLADVRLLTGTSALAGPITADVRDGTSALADAALASDLVDDPVVVLSQRPPRFPPALEAAGIAGAVRLAFVVDTTGRVEPASLRVVEMTASGFETAARDALLATRFRPARARGRLVRQLAEQWVRFAVQR